MIENTLVYLYRVAVRITNNQGGQRVGSVKGGQRPAMSIKTLFEQSLHRQIYCKMRAHTHTQSQIHLNIHDIFLVLQMCQTLDFIFFFLNKYFFIN